MIHAFQYLCLFLLVLFWFVPQRINCLRMSSLLSHKLHVLFHYIHWSALSQGHPHYRSTPYIHMNSAYVQTIRLAPQNTSLNLHCSTGSDIFIDTGFNYSLYKWRSQSFYMCTCSMSKTHFWSVQSKKCIAICRHTCHEISKAYTCCNLESLNALRYTIHHSWVSVCFSPILSTVGFQSSI